MSWLHPIVGGRAAGYVVAFLISVAIVGFFANRPRIFPGPVTAQERVARSRRWVGRFTSWGGLVLALASWIAIMLLIAPVSRPHVLVLHSRARHEDVRWDDAKRLLRWDGTPCTPRDERELDLGPGVDAALAKLATENVLGRDDFDARAAARLAMLDTRIDSTARLDALSRASHRERGQQTLPSWLIESVEISAVMAYSRTNHVTQIIVAPGGTKDLSGWKAVGAILSGRRIELCLQDEPNSQANDRIEVERIAFARWSPDAHAVTFWALVTGRMGADGATLRFQLVLPTGQSASLAGELPTDTASARLVPVCAGACTSPQPGLLLIRDPVVEGMESPRSIAALTDDGRVTATTRVEVQQIRRRPVLVVETPSRVALSSLLDAPTSDDYDAELLRTELGTLQLDLPTMVPDRAAVNLHVIEGHGRIAVTTSESVAAARDWLATHEIAPAAFPTRARESNLNLSTSLSWMALPVTAHTHPTPLPLVDATVTAGAQPAALEASPEQVKASTGIVAMVTGPGAARFGVIGIDLPMAIADRDSVLVIAAMRSLAWVAAWVVNPDFDQGLGLRNDRDQERLRCVPLLTEDDYDSLQRDASRLPDLLAIALISGHLLLAFRIRTSSTKRVSS